MPAIHIRDVPPDVLEALKRRAAAHHRSLQMELRSILCEIAQDSPAAILSRGLDLILSDANLAGDFGRDTIYGNDGR
ncbi:MAG: FitA-like ribbon-helix-helix domain-containing protein [Candidatus Xenobia bacterium]